MRGRDCAGGSQRNGKSEEVKGHINVSKQHLHPQEIAPTLVEALRNSLNSLDWLGAIGRRFV